MVSWLCTYRMWEADRLVREFARRRGITAAVKTAVREAAAREAADVDDLARRIRPIIDQIKTRKRADLGSDKAFMDEMWGEEP
jgi:hypothetical protein